MMKFSEIVKIIDIEPIIVGEGDAFRFRLEVRRVGLVFHGTVYRLETYRLQPSFPQSNGEVPEWKNDGLIHVVDDNFSVDALTGRSAEEVVDKFQNLLTDTFGPLTGE